MNQLRHRSSPLSFARRVLFGRTLPGRTLPGRTLHPHRFWMTCVLVCLVCTVVTPDIVQACPTCKDSLASSDPESANLVRGYFWSILFMMAMPFLIFTGISTLFYLQVRKGRTLRAQGLLPARVPGRTIALQRRPSVARAEAHSVNTTSVSTTA